MHRIPFLPILLAAAILAAGCTTAPHAPASPPQSPGNALLGQADAAFAAGNLHAAADLYRLAQENSTAAGNTTAATYARDRRMTAEMMTYDFAANRTAMAAQVAAAIPDASPALIDSYLDGKDAVILTSDGTTWYFSDTLSNIAYHNLTLMQAANKKNGYTPFYDELAPLASGTGSAVTPVTYEGRETLAVPRDRLPAAGVLKVWIPLPVEYGPQANVSILSVEPARYVKSVTPAGADIGLAYFEVPLDQVNGSFVNLTARFRFTEHGQATTIDPAKVLPYNTSNPEYRRYTAPSANIALTPAINATAAAIVGNETNPARKARNLYHAIVDTWPYSHAPHLWMEATGMPRSVYVQQTGIGDCGAQSQYFAALLRSQGIPARVPVGYQMILGPAGTHVWAEYYLEGYGWIPADVTVAEGADWSYNATPAERQRYRQYFGQNLDPYRYIIQKDVDLPLDPPLDPAEVVTTRNTIQIPVIVCDTCPENPSLEFPRDYWTIEVVRV